jgi:translation elongation factor EF-G
MTEAEVIKGDSDWHKNFYFLELVKIIDKLEEQKNTIFRTIDRQTIAETIEFLKKQNAEVERLQAMVDAELDTIHDLGDDYERVLEEENELVKTAKTEAIKEFAERLKENEGRRGVPIGTIERLVKEMTE